MSADDLVPPAPAEGQPAPSATCLVEYPKPPKYTRLSDDEKRKILVLRAEGLSLEQIAGATRRALSTISEFLGKYPDMTVEAAALLRTKAVRAVEKWDESLDAAAARGEYKGAKDLLAAVGVVRDQPIAAVAVQVNMPGSPLPAELRDLGG